MSLSPIIYPLLAQVFLTFALMILMAVKRVGAAQKRLYKTREIALNSSNYPADIIKYGNSYVNQFELPVLFYLLCTLLIISKQGESGLMVMLAWAFVGARIVHALIHVTSNHVLTRFYAFLASAIILVSMWGLFAFGQIA